MARNSREEIVKQPVHSISQSSGMTPERIVGIGFVVLFHVFVIWAIVAGLAPQIVKLMPRDIIVRFVPTPVKPETPVNVKPDFPTLRDEPTVRPPVIDIARDTGPTIKLGPPPDVQPQPVHPAVPDTAVSGIAGTHTIPPYPLLAIRMNEEGRVLLHLTVAQDGNVASATVTQSSGFTDLDQSAVAWVLAHWKYKPAIRGGVAIASATDAVVVFSLKSAR
jgi:protein TonB